MQVCLRLVEKSVSGITFLSCVLGICKSNPPGKTTAFLGTNKGHGEQQTRGPPGPIKTYQLPVIFNSATARWIQCASHNV